MGVHLNDYKVRFGDLSYGELMHANTYFDLTIQGCEELSHEIGYPVEEIVAEGGVPYAPAAVDIEIERYPGFETTIATTGRTRYVGDRSFGVEYGFDRVADGSRLATVTMTHVTLTPDGDPEPIPESVRERLESMREGPAERVERPDVATVDADPADANTFDRTITYRSPMVEAVDFGYFEDYFRQMTIALEAYLESLGISIRDGDPNVYPFFPTGGNFEFVKPIRFEDTITVHGRIDHVSAEAVTVAYTFVGDDGDDVRLHGALEFGSFDAAGERRAFPRPHVDALSESEPANHSN